MVYSFVGEAKHAKVLYGWSVNLCTNKSTNQNHHQDLATVNVISMEFLARCADLSIARGPLGSGENGTAVKSGYHLLLLRK